MSLCIYFFLIKRKFKFKKYFFNIFVQFFFQIFKCILLCIILIRKEDLKKRVARRKITFFVTTGGSRVLVLEEDAKPSSRIWMTFRAVILRPTELFILYCLMNRTLR